MQPLLQDAALQAGFERDGFVVTPLFSEAQVGKLLEIFEQKIARHEVTGLYESSRHNSFATNREINEAIRSELALAGMHLFLPAKMYGGTFMVKSHTSSDVLPLHQDWSVIEEEKYSTFFVWCPLVDVNVTNGCLYVLPGSHKYFDLLRSGTYPSNRYLLPAGLHRHVIDIPLKAGEAILYSDALFHGSYANNGTADRIVVTARVTEKEAPLVYFQKANESEVDVYRADEEFYLTHIDALAKGRLPDEATKLYRRPYKHVPVTEASLTAKIVQSFRLPETEKGPAMKPLFKDASLQAAFERDGYVVVDLLNQEQVDDLNAFYHGLNNAATPAYGFQVSLDNESPEFVRTVSQRLIAAVRESVDRYFQNHRIFTASFVTKAKSPLGVVPPHQDWTFVDESRFWSATIWCPLIDTNMDNGALGVIKGSHRFYDHVRPSPSPQYKPPFKDQLFSIFPYLTMLELKAGEAVIFDNRTLHASPPNTTDETRVAFGIGITQADAAIRHYYMLPGQSKPVMEAYDVSPEFFYDYNNSRLSGLYDQGLKPEGLNSLGVFTMSARHYETDELVEAIKAAGNQQDKALIQKMAALFDYNLDGTKKDHAAVSQHGDISHDKPPFWKVYTPLNILREIRYRVGRL